MKKILCSILAALICMAQNNAVIAEENFNQNQKKQIEQIIHDYLVNNPNVLVEASKKLQEQEVTKEQNQIQKMKANVSTYKKEIFDPKAAGRTITGNPKGKVIIAQFTQYQCSHCRVISPFIDKLLKNNPDIQLITIYWPFFGNDAIYASKAALAAQKQGKFTELNQAMVSSNAFLNKDKIDNIIKSIPGLDVNKLHKDMDTKEIDDGIKANLKLAANLGLMGTPTFIFTNSEMTKFSLIPGQPRNIENDLKKSADEVR